VSEQLEKLLQIDQDLSSPDHLHALTEYFNSLSESSPEKSEQWASDILKYGSIILASGSVEAQTMLLEQGWEPAFTERIKACGILDEWFDVEMQLIRELNYTPGLLFLRRAKQLDRKPLFNFKPGREWQQLSWSAVHSTVDHLAAGLIELLDGQRARIAIISENRLEVALTDIMCLSYGFVNVPIQPAAPPAQIEFILSHAEIDIVFVSDSQLLKTIENLKPALPRIKHIITFNDVVTSNPMVLSHKKLLATPNLEETMQWLEGVRLSVRLDDIASIMYTSGTTGNPKGILFSYENIISKRFARSLAFNVGSQDRLLCFLPLFHTFGRFLELWGSIFWGAEYTFSSGKGIHSLLDDLKTMKPSVLISIPKRWQDIYETVGSKVDIINENPDRIHPHLQAVTGGKLRWGLSAAGYLPPEIFRFFQEHGVQLHSGYGMTEATGGITMTPTGQYMENSVGAPLPGMELKLADDGELWIRGPYVSQAYWKPDVPEDRMDQWFTTGDIFQVLGNGQLEIIDRKKEIYKNAKGQTVAPQKIENMFRDFDSIHQLFIVGDHMPYNTALVRVNRRSDDIKGMIQDKQALRDYVARMIHSVNSFLAPFERIINFRLIDREFDKEKGELTEKGTYKRTVILEHFKEEIEVLYETPYKSYFLGELEVQIPNWVFLQRGWTTNDLEVKGTTLRHRSRSYRLDIRRVGAELRVGSFNYGFTGHVFQFEEFIRQPAYCLGNGELELFLDYDGLKLKTSSRSPDWLPGAWTASPLSDEDIVSLGKAVGYALENGDNSLDALKPVIRLLYAEELDPKHSAFRLLTRIYSNGDEKLRNIIRYAFLRLIRSDDPEQSRFAVVQILALYPANELEHLVNYALERKELFPIGKTEETWTNVNVYKVALGNKYLKWLVNNQSPDEDPSVLLKNIVGILCSWSDQYPRFFASIRTALISASVKLPVPHATRALLLDAYTEINSGFKRNMSRTESGKVVDWQDLILFDESIDAGHQDRIFKAFSTSTFFNESMYLFFEGTYLPLSHIPPQGIFINLLGSAHGKSVYRASIQGKDRSYRFAINLNDDLKPEQVSTELFWLLACGKDGRSNQVVETVGAYREDQDLWSEEFISGLTTRQYLQKSVWAGVSEELPAPEFIWPHFVWTGIYTYTSFWKQTRFKKMIRVPSPGKIIIPIHDYYSGGRLISISDIQDASNSLSFLENLEKSFVRSTETAFPEFNMKADVDIVYQAIREALGQKHAHSFFQEILNDPELSAARKKSLTRFLKTTESSGFQAKSVYFAIRRYHRWIDLNKDAILEAKAHFLKNLYRDYHVSDAEDEYPDARVQLFNGTVFSDSEPELLSYLNDLGTSLRQGAMDAKSLQSEISQFIAGNDLSEYTAFFLKRLAFPELPPSEDIELIATRSTALDDLEVMISRHDQKGGTYMVRKAMNPKEIIQLQHLFHRANMEVHFTQDHQYLVALNQKERVIGGLFFIDQTLDSVYMDKVVVSEAYRGTGISRGILDDFFNRMGNAGKKMVITGFLHPGYFYKFGFRIEKDQGGLVKYL
jgi:long-chain acyl-CoA synthetase